MPMTMKERINHAKSALNQYQAEKGDSLVDYKNVKLDSADLSDLIADLYHLGRSHGFQPEDIHATALMHYEAELAEEAYGVKDL